MTDRQYYDAKGHLKGYSRSGPTAEQGEALLFVLIGLFIYLPILLGLGAFFLFLKREGLHTALALLATGGLGFAVYKLFSTFRIAKRIYLICFSTLLSLGLFWLLLVKADMVWAVVIAVPFLLFSLRLTVKHTADSVD